MHAQPIPRSSSKETSEAKLPFDGNNPSTYKEISAPSRGIRLSEASLQSEDSKGNHRKLVLPREAIKGADGTETYAFDDCRTCGIEVLVSRNLRAARK